MCITDVIAVLLGLIVAFICGEFEGFNSGFNDCLNKLLRRK